MSERTKITTKAPGSGESISFPKTKKPGLSKKNSSIANQILHLQLTMGNQAVQRLIKSGTIQAKLKIGQPNDKYEQEADRVADQVMRMPEPKGALVNSHSSLVQRKSACPDCPEREEIQTKPLADQITPLVQRQVGPEKEEEEEVQAKQSNNPAPAVTANIEASINSIRGGGLPLPESTRSYFEPRFGTDFSQVRLHTDSRAAETAKSVNAKAFTTGKDIVFDAGQYSPGTSTGKHLLAHELTHVVQKNSDGYRGTPPMISLQETNDTDDNQAMPQPTLYHFKIGNREIVLTESEYNARKKRLIREFKKYARDGRELAEFYRGLHKHHMEKVRGWAGVISDFLNEIYPPSITMWDPTILKFNRAEQNIEMHNLQKAYVNLQLGYQWLNEDIKRWESYIRNTVDGAERVVATLEVIRDASIAIEVALFTGGTAYAVLGGGKLAAGAATVSGVAAGAKAAQYIPGEFGEAARGTWTEVKAAGLKKNLKYAANGIHGMAYGIGKGFDMMFEGLKNLFEDPKKFAEDIGKFPQYIQLLWEHREVIWNHFDKLPPEEQAFRVGVFFGVIESMLMTIEAGNQIGGVMGSESSAFGASAYAFELVPAADFVVMKFTLVNLEAELLALYGTSFMMTTQTSGIGGELGKKTRETETGKESTKPARHTRKSHEKTEDVFAEISVELGLKTSSQKVPKKEWLGEWETVRKDVYKYIFGERELPVNKKKVMVSVHHIIEKTTGGRHTTKNLLPILQKVHNRISGIYSRKIIVGGKRMRFRDWVGSLSMEYRRGIGYKVLFENITRAEELQLHQLIKQLEQLGMKMKTFHM